MKKEELIKFNLKSKEALYERMIRDSHGSYGRDPRSRELLQAEIQTLKWVLF